MYKFEIKYMGSTGVSTTETVTAESQEQAIDALIGLQGVEDKAARIEEIAIEELAINSVKNTLSNVNPFTNKPSEKEEGAGQFAISMHDKKGVMTVYIMFLASIVLGMLLSGGIIVVAAALLPIAALVISYMKKGSVSDAASSHYRNYITMFWTVLVCTIMFMLIGLLIEVVMGFRFYAFAQGVVLVGTSVVSIWSLYRVIRGLLLVLDRKEYPSAKS